MFTRVNIICSGSKAENVFLFCQLKLAFCFDVETFFLSKPFIDERFYAVREDKL